MAHDDSTPTNPGELHTALVHTKDLHDFKIPDGQPDPRGWSVKTADGNTIGKVEDLLFDTGEGRVRYLEVKTDGDVSKHGGRDYFLLPIGTARLDDEHDDVIVQMAAEQLTGAPPYERGNMTRDYETSLRDYVREQPDTPRTMGSEAIAQPSAVASTASEREVNFYGSREYDDDSFFSRGRNRTEALDDRIVQKADDIKDRFDGNPASQPGPDATDRR